MTFGGLAGLWDVPLLPSLYTHVENRPAKELLLLAALVLLNCVLGMWPIGINTDDSLSDFHMIASCLEDTLMMVLMIL